MKIKTQIATFALFILFCLLSCSKEEFKEPNQTASRVRPIILASTVQIGTQEWMTKNLNVSRYRNGDPIPQVTDPTQWNFLTTGAWCYYMNNTANGLVYGKLYNWYAVNDPRGLAPAGYHVPSYEEWTTLATFLGGTSVAGGKMKSTGTLQSGTGLWKAPNTGATNSSGFTGFPGGGLFNNATFIDLGSSGTWWSTTSYNVGYAWCCGLNFGYRDVGITPNFNKSFALSVRCLKD